MSRLSLVFLLALLPVIISIRCYVGGGINGAEIVLDAPCPNAMYCYKNTSSSNGVQSFFRNCDSGLVCKKTGCHTSNGVKTCCCNTDHCNGAAGASLLMTSLVALGAAWAWS